MSQRIFRQNDNLIEWQWFSKSTDGEYVNNGNVTFTLFSGYELDDATGLRTPSVGSVNVSVYGPVAMQYVPGSNGKYQGLLPASVQLNLALKYTLEINATA